MEGNLTLRKAEPRDADTIAAFNSAMALETEGRALIPEIIGGAYNVQQFAFGGTSLLIVVSVTMDTVAQIQSHLIAHQYGDLIKKAIQ